MTRKIPSPYVTKTGFGAALERARQYAGVSLKELAQHLKISVPFLSDVECGRRTLSDTRIKCAATYLGTDPQLLLERASFERGRIVLDINKLTDEQFNSAVQILLDSV